MLSSEGDRQVNWMLRRCAVYSRKQAGNSVLMKCRRKRKVNWMLRRSSEFFKRQAGKLDVKKTIQKGQAEKLDAEEIV